MKEPTVYYRINLPYCCTTNITCIYQKMDGSIGLTTHMTIPMTSMEVKNWGRTYIHTYITLAEVPDVAWVTRFFSMLNEMYGLFFSQKTLLDMTVLLICL